MNTQSAPPKHTPGPWITSTGRVPGLGRAFGVLKESHKPGEKGESICVVCKEDNTQPHDVANAMLIAAAPELLAACIDTVKLMDELIQDRDMSQLDANRLWEKARAAVTKALGSNWQNVTTQAPL